jgi:hypothetical protein
MIAVGYRAALLLGRAVLDDADNTRPHPSLLLWVRATRAAPLAASDRRSRISFGRCLEPAPGWIEAANRAGSPSLRQVACSRRDRDRLEARS